MNNPPINSVLMNCPACHATVSKQAPSCPRCGQPLQSPSFQSAVVQQKPSPPAPKKRGCFSLLGIGCLSLIGLFMFAGFIGSIAIPKATSRPQSAETTETTDAPAPKQQAAKKSVKKKTKEQRVSGGLIELNDEEGNPRPYSLTCFRKLTEMHILDEKKITKNIKTAIYERCLDLDGNAVQAVQEMAKWAELNDL